MGARKHKPHRDVKAETRKNPGVSQDQQRTKGKPEKVIGIARNSRNQQLTNTD